MGRANFKENLLFGELVWCTEDVRKSKKKPQLVILGMEL